MSGGGGDGIIMFTMSATGAIVGATVSALVYTTLSTGGDAAASVTGSGIELAGSAIGYGTDFIIGKPAGAAVRGLAKGYSTIVRPAISSTSRLGAAGVSILAGTGAALTTNAIVYGGKKVGSYIYSRIEDYKQRAAIKVQHETPLDGFSDMELILLDDKLRPTYFSPNGEEIVKNHKDDNNNEHPKKEGKNVRWDDHKDTK